MYLRYTFSRSIRLLVALTLLGMMPPGAKPVTAHQNAGTDNVVEGSNGNSVTDGVNGGTISGGGQMTFPNQVLFDFGTVGGGRGNSAGNYSAVSGGEYNKASGIRATIGGGAENVASRDSTVIGGGFSNTASQSFATVGGGTVNMASSSYTTISGGAGNHADGRFATIGGGTRNQAQSAYTFIGGGSFNQAAGGTSTIGGGTGNHTPGIGSVIGGGAGNNAAGLESTISGGLSNRITDNYSIVAGGRQNIAGNGNDEMGDKPYASVGGGYGNQAGGTYATIPGGYENQALGDYSFAAGNQAQVDAGHPGTFLFADSSNFAFKSVAPNEFAARATGGVRFVTSLDANGVPLAGVRLAPGSGSWETLSDRNAKAAILPVNPRQVLDALMGMPVSTWRYRGQSDTVQHLGPMAQDFYAAFGLGEDSRYISSVDADGVALAAIQGLYQIVQEKDARISSLQAQNADQEQRLNELEKRVTELESRNSGSTSQANNPELLVLALIVGLILGRYFWVSRKVL